MFLVSLGAALLLFPFANTTGEWTPFMDALFTATSAVTVTGLVVVDTPVYWSFAGQAVIWALILVGGLGWMTLAGFILILVGHRITLPQRLAFQESVGAAQIGGVLRLIRNLMVTALAFQLVGGIVLAVRFRQVFEWGWAEAAWHGIFQSVSGFNNAGFTTVRDSSSLGAFAGDPLVLGVMAVLIVLGGLSFAVIADLARVRRFSRFSLDSKIVLVSSGALWLLGVAVVFAFEYGNEQTLGPMSVPVKLMNATFQSITTRAAGFSTISFGLVAPATAFFVMALMIIGTASASAGGGIRLNTLGVLVATIVASIRGREQISAFGREIAPTQLHRAVGVTTMAATLVFLVAFVLTFIEGDEARFINLLFEAVSAVGTVGLSTGITPDLGIVGKLLIIVTMVVGRIGPLTLALTLMPREQKPALYRYARERVRIG
jgi:trk system potassium uptake protein TrkH